MSKLINNWSLGSDPEFFLRSKKTKEFVPSYHYIGGDKWNPIPISEEGHNIQCDNVMVEVGIPPSKTVEEWIKHHTFVQDYIKRTIAEPNDLELVVFPFADFPADAVKSRKAKAFGCDPDFCVYKDNKPNEIDHSKITTGRCAGGHIHIGYDNHTEEVSNLIIRAMDLFLSVPLMLFEPANRRKEMYGLSGAFRPQPWGVEYRVTSNYIMSSVELLSWSFKETVRALEFINEYHTSLPEILTGNRLETIINSKDVEACKKLVAEFNLTVVETKRQVLA